MSSQTHRRRTATCSDNFAPVHEEHTTFDLPVTGAVPAHLDGRYLRIGPNPVADPGPGHHWFVGEGMVHGVRLEGGRARWYRNRQVRARGDDFAPNTNVLEHAGRTLALVEAGAAPYELTARARHRSAATRSARSPAATPPTRTRTRRPASCTRCPTAGPAATWSTTPCVDTDGRSGTRPRSR